MNKVVVFDIDNVLADFEGRLVDDVLMSKYGFGIATKKRDSYSFEERWREMPEVLADALDFVNDPNSYYGLNAIDQMIEFAQANEGQGAVIYVSARPILSLYFTKRWLNKHGLLSNPEIHLAYCGISDKAAFLSDLSGSVDFIVEDSPETIRALKEAGLPAWCFGREWNEGLYPRLRINPSGVLVYQHAKGEFAEPVFEALAETEA